MDQPALPLPEAPEHRRRGRPPGAKNKRSTDLARYVEAHYGGMTPGQQAAAIGMVSSTELRQAKAKIRELKAQGAATGLDPHMLALVMKAQLLASALGVKAGEAWAMMAKERAELLPYIHQKRPQAVDLQGGAALPMVFMVPDGQAAAPVLDLGADEWSEAADTLAFPLQDQPLAEAPLRDVSQPKSHGEPEPEAG